MAKKSVKKSAKKSVKKTVKNSAKNLAGKRARIRNGGAAGGAWPIPDIIMIGDYPGVLSQSSTNTNEINSANRCVRIHMDVNYDTKNDDIEGMIRQGHLTDAYNAIITYNKSIGKPGTAAGLKVLQGAFGL